jgi:DNA-directed RNA polymerase specialized sigma24 family protein
MFTTTHWSVVLEAQGESPAAQAALENLCRTYWRPIYGFVRREGSNSEEAKDITQGFFALILERKDFHSVRQEKGRLRCFLLASLKHFMANQRRDAATIKRGSGRAPIPSTGLDRTILASSIAVTHSALICFMIVAGRSRCSTECSRVCARNLRHQLTRRCWNG